MNIENLQNSQNAKMGQKVDGQHLNIEKAAAFVEAYKQAEKVIQVPDPDKKEKEKDQKDRKRKNRRDYEKKDEVDEILEEIDKRLNRLLELAEEENKKGQ